MMERVGWSLLESYPGWSRSWDAIISGYFSGDQHIDLLFYDQTLQRVPNFDFRWCRKFKISDSLHWLAANMEYHSGKIWGK